MTAADSRHTGAAGERVFPASVAVVPDVIALIAAEAGAWGLHPRRVRQLELAVEEAVVNICLYAYAPLAGEFVVRVEPGAERFVVELIDEGVPFDPLTVGDPDLSSCVEERAVGGLGIFLARRVVDELAYRRDASRNVLSLAMGRT